MSELKLYMLLLGCKPPGRHTEQHDVFFGIAASLKELVPEIEGFWKQPNKIHIDAWREVKQVDGYSIRIVPRESNATTEGPKLFFINLGGYQENRFEEQHYFVLTVKPDKTAAFQEARQTLFFQHNHFPGANSHIDDKYGIDVDDLYEMEDMLSDGQKEKYQLIIEKSTTSQDDSIHLGYFKLGSLDGY